MAATQPETPSADQDKQARQQLSALIARFVLHILGHPADLLRVQVRKLWQDRYRVNVLVGKDAASVKVAHSYFLVVDEGGNITTTSPKLTRVYEPLAGPDEA